MKTLDLEQGTPEWLAARAGKVTASRISDVLATIKSGESAARRDYKADIVSELLTGQPIEPGYVNEDMKRGIENEPFARAAYEVAFTMTVDKVGFVIHPTIERAGCSPDGLVPGTTMDGLVEIKCPKRATHSGYLIGGVVPPKYVPQMMWQMACCDVTWNDFVSYNADFPPNLQLFRVRLFRDTKMIEEMEAKVGAFLGEVDTLIYKLTHLEAAK